MHSLIQQLHRLARYNYWANECIASAIATVPVEWLDKEQKSSFSSIRKTTNHLFGAEIVWLNRMQGVSFTQFPEQDYPHPSQYHASSSLLLAFIEKQDDTFFSEVITYKSFAGDAFETPVFDILQHVFNHSTFHRGQLVTLLRGCGFEGKLSQTDFITWQRMNAI